MRAERAVKALLDGAAGVTSLVGGASPRIYGGAAPQEAAAPLLIYSKSGASREPVLRPTESRVVDALIDVLCVARTYGALKDLGEQVRLALNGASGTIATTVVLGITIEAEGPDQYEPQLDEFAQLWTFRVSHTE